MFIVVFFLLGDSMASVYEIQVPGGISEKKEYDISEYAEIFK